MDGAADGAKRAWRRKAQSEESKEKERARNRRAQVPAWPRLLGMLPCGASEICLALMGTARASGTQQMVHTTVNACSCSHRPTKRSRSMGPCVVQRRFRERQKERLAARKDSMKVCTSCTACAAGDHPDAAAAKHAPTCLPATSKCSSASSPSTVARPCLLELLSTLQ